MATAEGVMRTASEITVIIPAYNAAGFLLRTLETVAAQREQPGAIVVADDGSSDATVSVAAAFAASHPECAVRVLREPHRGPGAARNAALRAADTAWVAFLDSDDRWEQEKIARIAAAIDRHPAVNFWCHNQTIQFLDGTSRVTDLAAAYDPTRPLSPQLWRNNLFLTSAVVCRRDLVLSVGGFDENLTSAQDYELWLRMSQYLVARVIDIPLGRYIERHGNISTSRFWKRLRNLWRVKHRHRDKVSFVQYLLLMTHATIFHLVQPIAGSLRHRMRRGTL